MSDPISQEVLANYYADKKFEYGFASDCKMHLPVSDLKGKRVLDVGCRRGRGVYKISSMVGNDGEAFGTDWVRTYVDEAVAGIDRAWHDSGLKHNNMDIRFAYPEDLISAGFGSQTVDYVYTNNAINLYYSQEATLREFGRVLRRGGMLILETVYASDERDPEFIERAKKIGNSIQASLTEDQVRALLDDAGFGEARIVDEYEIARDRGYTADERVEAIPGDETTVYRSVTLNVVKK